MIYPPRGSESLGFGGGDARACSIFCGREIQDPPIVQMGFAPGVLINLKDDSMPRLGVGAQDLTWLSRAIEKGQHGHTRAQTGTH